MTDTTAAPGGILCVSHLAWETTLFQRPQQLMQQFAARGYRVGYAGCVGYKKRRQHAVAGKAPGLRWIHSSYAAEASTLAAVRQKIAAFEVKQVMPEAAPIIWLYHPSLLPLVQDLPRKLLVYDVMDRFDAFDKNANAAAADERLLLQRADVIFTGGASLQASIEQKLEGANRSGHPPICFPSGIDFDHFAKATTEAVSVPAEIQSFPKPIFGYFGAVDERIDYTLLTQLAATGGSVVLVGPQITPPPPALPSNIHILNARPYSELPAFLRGFDVCLLPFRNTELVAHISPTKTPEYLAGGKPVVSTTIPDVASAFGDVVTIAATADEFVEACRAALTAPPDVPRLQEAARRARTWKQIALEMDAILRQRLA